VAMAQGETYEALQKGVAEGTIGPIEVLKGWRQAEVIKHTTDCANVGYTTTMFVVMNLNKWNQLPENIKNIFTDVSREYIAIHGKTWDEVDKAGRDYTTSLGNDFISLDDNEKERWKKAVEPVIAEYVAGVDKKGLPGNQYIENINALIRQYGSK
jgi:TRAP-type C4-dicarboxylate transport system substrate-binding protein